MGADAPRLHLLVRIEQAAARIEHVLEHRRAGDEAWDQPVAAPRIAAILGIVARDPKLARLAGVELGGAAAVPVVRSDQRRVGKEGYSPCISRWSTVHLKT